MNSPAVVVLLSLTSGIVGALLSSLLYLSYERKKLKIDAARRLLANRYHTTGDEFTRALNEVYVVFAGEKEVIAALKSYHDVVVSGQEVLSLPRLIALFRAVLSAAGIDTSQVDDSFFAIAFNVRK